MIDVISQRYWSLQGCPKHLFVTLGSFFCLYKNLMQKLCSCLNNKLCAVKCIQIYNLCQRRRGHPVYSICTQFCLGRKSVKVRFYNFVLTQKLYTTQLLKWLFSVTEHALVLQSIAMHGCGTWYNCCFILIASSTSTVPNYLILNVSWLFSDMWESRLPLFA